MMGICSTAQVTGGITRYFASLISRLPEDCVPIVTTIRRPQVNFPVHKNLTVFHYTKFRPASVSNRLQKYFFRAATALNRFDIAHPTYYFLITGRELSHYRCPLVITVWDMINELFPKETDAGGEQAAQKRKAVMTAQAILCISENTKKDLLEQYAVPESKITVTPLASELNESQSHGPERVPSIPYFLYVGSRVSYKNFSLLLRAFAKAVSARPSIGLCVVGGVFTSEEMRIIAGLRLQEKVFQVGYVSDSQLAKLYRCSVAFIYPSLYEGFGIPLLEALSCGTPVVASNRSSIPEVVGDAAVLFNPSLINELVDILLLLLDHPAERERLIARGFKRAEAFSWNKTVEQTMTVYRSFMK